MLYIVSRDLRELILNQTEQHCSDESGDEPYESVHLQHSLSVYLKQYRAGGLYYRGSALGHPSADTE